MKVIGTGIPDLFILEPQVFTDSRGYFFESYNFETFGRFGLNMQFVQDNESKSSYGVIRGLHYQLAPYAQTKLVRVVLGSILDVVVDIRKTSPTFGKSFAVELNDSNKHQLLVPRGFAHGFSVLSQTAVINYKCDTLYNKEMERGINYCDPALNIDWRIPTESAIVSAKDKLHPSFAEAEMNFYYGEK